MERTIDGTENTGLGTDSKVVAGL